MTVLNGSTLLTRDEPVQSGVCPQFQPITKIHTLRLTIAHEGMHSLL